MSFFEFSCRPRVILVTVIVWIVLAFDLSGCRFVKGLAQEGNESSGFHATPTPLPKNEFTVRGLLHREIYAGGFSRLKDGSDFTLINTRAVFLMANPADRRFNRLRSPKWIAFAIVILLMILWALLPCFICH